MADRGRPFFRSRRYTPALPEAVQPPDDRTYSAEVTVFQRNLPHHRSARAESPYTRSIMIPSVSPFVKNFFRIFHEILYLFSVKTENSFYSFPPANNSGTLLPLPAVSASALRKRPSPNPGKVVVFSLSPHSGFHQFPSHLLPVCIVELSSSSLFPFS